MTQERGPPDCPVSFPSHYNDFSIYLIANNLARRFWQSLHCPTWMLNQVDWNYPFSTDSIVHPVFIWCK